MQQNYQQLIDSIEKEFSAGDLARADDCCLQLLAMNPRNGLAWQWRGRIASGEGDMTQAVKHFSEAVDCDPTSAAFRHNYGVACQLSGDLDTARQCYQRAISLQPGYALAYASLAGLKRQTGNPQGAVRDYRTALENDSRLAAAWSGLVNVLFELGDRQEACAAVERAVPLVDDPELRLRLGTALVEHGYADRALVIFRLVEDENPEQPGLQHNIGIALTRLGCAEDAVVVYQDALAANPDDHRILNNLGQAQLELWRVEEAIGSFRRAVRLQPDYTTAGSNLLLAMNYVETEPDAIHQESMAFAERLSAGHSAKPVKHASRPDAHEKIRIGYISGDFCNHSVARFFLPLIQNHDRGAFETYCYSTSSRADDVTSLVKERADCWINISDQSDREAAERIQRDQVDILVDLSGHTANNRLPVFAYRPAPVQVNWLGYPNTTGLKEIDFRLTDEIADPEGQSDEFYTERLFRLPGGFLTYQDDPDAPAVADVPSMAAGEICFGSFNTLAKLTPQVIEVWASVLHSLPRSRLIIKSYALANASVVAELKRLVAQHGIDPNRLDCHGPLQKKADHLNFYSRVDIALDTFPYNGTTTTCEALWMGVPVVALCGNHHAGRVGASILHRVGLSQLIAADTAGYAEIASELARDEPFRTSLRKDLRRRMRQSELMNHAGFARSVEDAFRAMLEIKGIRRGTD